MGQKHEYDCPRCGYSAFVSGGMGFGMEAVCVMKEGRPGPGRD